jgi:hypothetical protein
LFTFFQQTTGTTSLRSPFAPSGLHPRQKLNSP